MFYKVGEESNGTQSVAGIINGLEEIFAFQDVIDVVNFSSSVVCSDYISGEFQNLLGNLQQTLGGLLNFDSCGWIDTWRDLMSGMPDVTFVVSAGNAAGTGNNAREIIATKRDNSVIPAAFSLELDNVITVGGMSGTLPRGRTTGLIEDRDSNSNFGEAVTVGAPYTVWTMDIEADGGYAHRSGTSFGAPLVSGAVALMKALDPALSPRQIKEMLFDTGTIIFVCNSSRNHPSDRCPQDEQEWRKLDAGAAIDELLGRSVRANIDLSLVSNPETVNLNDTVDLSFPVKNEGELAWNFYMDALVCAPSGNGYKYQIPLPSLVRPGGTALFPLSFTATESGTWKVDVKMFRASKNLDTERDSPLDTELLYIYVPGPAVTSGASPDGTAANIAQSPSPSTAVTTAQPVATPEGQNNVGVSVKCITQPKGTEGGIGGADANVVLVADTSGSMEGDKIVKLRAAILDFISRVEDPAEYIALIDFDSDIDVAIELDSFGATEGLWSAAVGRLDSEGGTALYDAVAYAVDLLEGIGSQDRSNVIIALTDGVDGGSGRTLDQVIAEIEGASVQITLFGLA